MYKCRKPAVFPFFMKVLESSMNQAYFEGLALLCAIFDGMFFLSGTSVPALWRVSTGCQERLTAGTALSALLL